MDPRMSGRTWVYSDPHFYHKNIVNFTKEDGSKLRPWDDAEQMTEDMIRWYNEVVHEQDRVYILGDVAFTASHMLRSAGRLKGRKVLVPGNHEPPKMRKYFDLFDDVRGYVVKKGFIMSHTHANQVTLDYEPDNRYFCACVEQTNFRPILLDDILKSRGIV